MITLKTILCGDGGVGKTSLVRVFMKEQFSKDYLLTVGVDVKSKVIELENSKIVLSVSDIAGQDRFESFREIFFKGAALALLVFDLTRLQSLKNLEYSWIPQLAQISNPKSPVQCILIGNKSDLEDLRSISSKEAIDVLATLEKKFRNLNFSGGFLETSALAHQNVDNAFFQLTKAFLKNTNLS